MSNSLFKGTLKPIILELLSKEQTMYGYQLTQKAKEITSNNLNITEGALYPILHKLESEGLISSQETNINGRRRKYYSLTKKGNVEVIKERKKMTQYISSLTLIFK